VKLFDKVGLDDVPYTTPLVDTIEPPSDVTFPPVVGLNAPAFVIGDVVTCGKQPPQVGTPSQNARN
jgi:hypothetical protein